jgi:hypothetical protein
MASLGNSPWGGARAKRQQKRDVKKATAAMKLGVVAHGEDVAEDTVRTGTWNRRGTSEYECRGGRDTWRTREYECKGGRDTWRTKEYERRRGRDARGK